MSRGRPVAHAGRMRRHARLILPAVLIAAGGAWGVLALHFAMRGPPGRADGLATLFGLAMAGCLLALPRRAGGRWAGMGVAAGLFAAVLTWWLCLQPSNARDWEPEYRLMPSVRRDGDRIHFDNIRNATYHTADDATVAYDDAEFDLRTLNEVDLVSSYWAGNAIAHVFLSFGFNDGRHVAISVETRRERGEAYSALAGFFRRYEIIYVVADEGDLIGVRTDIRRESVYLYRLRATPDERRALLLSYVDRIETLSKTPEFYNTLDNNCTTNVLARANAASGQIPDSWMVLVSGYADRYVYELGRIDSNRPFADVKSASRIRRPPGAAVGPGFSADIRRTLPD